MRNLDALELSKVAGGGEGDIIWSTAGADWSGNEVTGVDVVGNPVHWQNGYFAEIYYDWDYSAVSDFTQYDYNVIDYEAQGVDFMIYSSILPSVDQTLITCVNPASWRWNDLEALEYDEYQAAAHGDVARLLARMTLGDEVHNSVYTWATGRVMADIPITQDDIAGQINSLIAGLPDVYQAATVVLGAGMVLDQIHWEDELSTIQQRIEVLEAGGVQ